MNGWDYLKKLEDEDKQARRKAWKERVDSQPTPTQAEAKTFVGRLLMVEEGLTEWEMTFLDDVNGRKEDFTPAQLRTIGDVYRRIFP